VKTLATKRMDLDEEDAEDEDAGGWGHRKYVIFSVHCIAGESQR
jgi:hypothetical protein